MGNWWQRAPGWVHLLVRFWIKINNDWIFNLANMLAYIVLLSAFPMLFVVLEVGGYIVGVVAPGEGAHLQSYLDSLLPSGSQLLTNVTYNLRQSGSGLFILIFLLSAFTGSRLFLTLENAFSLIFRVPGRTVVRQNIMAFIMMLICAVLLPLILLASLLPSTLVSLTPLASNSAFRAFLLQVLGGAVAVVTAALFFGVLYYFVPNRRTHVREILRGTLTASALLVIYEALFPVFAHLVLRPATYGATVGLVVAILVFFYYLSFILLIGAEIDAWALGLRDAPADIAGMLHWAEPFYHEKTGDMVGENPPQPETPPSSMPTAPRTPVTRHGLPPTVPYFGDHQPTPPPHGGRIHTPHEHKDLHEGLPGQEDERAETPRF